MVKELTYRRLPSELKQLEDICRAYFLRKLSGYPEELVRRYRLDLAFWGALLQRGHLVFRLLPHQDLADSPELQEKLSPVRDFDKLVASLLRRKDWLNRLDRLAPSEAVLVREALKVAEENSKKYGTRIGVYRRNAEVGFQAICKPSLEDGEKSIDALIECAVAYKTWEEKEMEKRRGGVPVEELMSRLSFRLETVRKNEEVHDMKERRTTQGGKEKQQ